MSTEQTSAMTPNPEPAERATPLCGCCLTYPGECPEHSRPTANPAQTAADSQSETGTPRTDAEVWMILSDIGDETYGVDPSFARTLEREAQQLRCENERLTAAYDIQEKSCDELRTQLAQVTATLLSVACVSVEQLKERYLSQMERSNRRDLPHGFDSWEAFYNHIQGITKERDDLKAQRDDALRRLAEREGNG